MKKSKKRADAKPRKTWVGLYTRKAPTKRESELRIARKHKLRNLPEEEDADPYL